MNKKLHAIICLLGVGVLASCGGENFGPVITPEKGIEVLEKLYKNETSKIDTIPEYKAVGKSYTKRANPQYPDDDFEERQTVNIERNNTEHYFKYTSKRSGKDFEKEEAYYVLIDNNKCVVIDEINKLYAYPTGNRTEDPVEIFNQVARRYSDFVMFIERGFYNARDVINESLETGEFMLKHLKVHSKNEDDLTVDFFQRFTYETESAKGSEKHLIKVRDKICTYACHENLFNDPNKHFTDDSTVFGEITEFKAEPTKVDYSSYTLKDYDYNF